MLYSCNNSAKACFQIKMIIPTQVEFGKYGNIWYSLTIHGKLGKFDAIFVSFASLCKGRLDCCTCKNICFLKILYLKQANLYAIAKLASLANNYFKTWLKTEN